jgi:hypothetical protein
MSRLAFRNLADGIEISGIAFTCNARLEQVLPKLRASGLTFDVLSEFGRHNLTIRKWPLPCLEVSMNFVQRKLTAVLIYDPVPNNLEHKKNVDMLKLWLRKAGEPGPCIHQVAGEHYQTGAPVLMTLFDRPNL